MPPDRAHALAVLAPPTLLVSIDVYTLLLALPHHGGPGRKQRRATVDQFTPPDAVPAHATDAARDGLTDAVVAARTLDRDRAAALAATIPAARYDAVEVRPVMLAAGMEM